ncbi:NUDIX domain-containing protein [Clostridium sp. YIM B02505]|uniref:NUDIX domain-containing protein n=1 Tax=Clostridium yunnanense TaxID=2800325 RepID=A0ABS1EV30_9CLOT|nr:NUDIX domain-containing protein [Clostridium yunnanense]MBK1813241.1 NUDIX domain-containing protein [Clostridium yunnanense]
MILPTHIVASGGVVTNEKEEVLLIRNPRKGWEYPGGIIESGETVPQGLIREIKEETGVVVEIINVIGIYSNTKKKKGYNGVEEVPTIVNIDFVCKYISGELRTSDESVEVKWFSKEEALKIIKPKQKLRFERALNCESGFSCLGYEVNSLDEIDVHEEYLFER